MLSVLQNLHHSIFLENEHSWHCEHNIHSRYVYFLNYDNKTALLLILVKNLKIAHFSQK